MNISKINNQMSFGKTPLLTCQIKQRDSKKKVPAVLYQMDTSNPKDVEELRNSSIWTYLFDQSNTDVNKFYVLKNDKTKETISSAEVSYRYRTSNENPGLSTLIEELDINKNYVNGVEPMLAYIARDAQNRYNNTIYASFLPDEIPVDLKHFKFSKGKFGNWFLTNKRFDNLINNAQKRSQIEFIA